MFRLVAKPSIKSAATLFARPSFNRYYSVNAAAQGSFLSKDEVTERIINVLKKHEKVDPTKVAPSSHFVNDLALDSLDSTEVVMEVENEFGIEIPDEEAFKLQSVEDCIKYISSNPMAK
ncbi:acyl carrier protein [Naegleria gruberi]|uniref:Acyl carrier protein n=1 Tax=Naegleria gruberi TaxID=5762 RepID=D2VIF8_NAEGR|nr:acyl carrier protein [Naegleria gruberi]EFC43258.1 acyl carrier protein [Naegleria gruberi]|eukprot:XP_002676002.1 acyl carrier protein [Naegleria gruberi strain NEG-M]